MRTARIILVALLVMLMGGLLAWLALMPQSDPKARKSTAALSPTGSDSTGPAKRNEALHLGIIPERDIFVQRARYRALAEYLSPRMGRDIELVTSASYEGILDDLRESRVDFAFLGSLVAVLAVDRQKAHVTLKTESPDGASTYQGVIFVRSDSPIQSVEQLTGRSIAMVRTTMAGHLYPMYELYKQGMMDSIGPIVWSGTHDDVIMEVSRGEADAGAAKDLRLNVFERAHSDVPPFRRLAISQAVPDSALVCRYGLPEDVTSKLNELLLGMDQTAEGRRALETFGARRFLPCDIGQFQAVFSMARAIMSQWDRAGIPSPPPAAPSAHSPQGG